MNVKEIRELICDMNAVEIAVHITHGDLHEWIGQMDWTMEGCCVAGLDGG